jgi:hypothetical protein
VLLVALSTTALTCSGGNGPDPRFVKPPLAAQPTKLLTMGGRLDSGVQLTLQIEYQTTNDACEITTNSLAGTSFARVYQHDLPVQIAGDRYTAIVPLDLVDDRECTWAPFSINYIVMVNGKRHIRPLPPSPLVWFRNGDPDAISPFAVSCAPSRNAGGGIECGRPPGEYFLSLKPESLHVDFLAPSGSS